MVIREYPKEIKELIDTCEPYLVGCHLENAPPEVLKAEKELKEWFFSQGQ